MEDLQQFLETLDIRQLLRFSDALHDAHIGILTLLNTADSFTDIHNHSWTKKIRNIRQELLQAVEICEEVEATEITKHLEFSSTKVEV